ncbi:hypothetical protein QQX98_012009 [Neonectria punicea]|uniref:Uncharacterized protein n=1 Tax=Neonectria punicea TaxID=979145 RepID=A0ABR1GKG4_9HYPO
MNGKPPGELTIDRFARENVAEKTTLAERASKPLLRVTSPTDAAPNTRRDNGTGCLRLDLGQGGPGSTASPEGTLVVELAHLNALPVEQAEHGQLIPSDDSEEVARRRYKARYGFAQLTGQFCAADDNLRAFNPDLDPRDPLVDPKTGTIAGFVDLEFTNAMPAQFGREPPLWLFKVLPGQCLENGCFF